MQIFKSALRENCAKNCTFIKLWFCETRTFLAFVYAAPWRDVFEKPRFCKKSVVFGGHFVNDTVFKKYTFGHMSHEKFISRFFKSVLFQRFLVCKRRPLYLDLF